MNLKLLIPFIFLLLPVTNLFAGDLPDKPNPPHLVNDFAGILTENDAYMLEKKLWKFEQETSTQISIVTVNDLAGYDPADFTISLAEKWGIGQKGKDNGILIMVKPTGGKGERHAFIAVGYGLEGVIPDAIANRIVDNEMIPNFKLGNYYGGLNAAVDVLMSLSRGEFTAEQYSQKTAAKQYSDENPIGLIIVILAFVLFFLKPAFMARRYMYTNNLGFWAALWLILSSGRSGNGFLNSDYRDSGFGGFGNGGSSGFGGFGGFGGGSFGGGGAGGSW